MSNLYFGITRYRYDICSEISDMACFSLNLKTAVDFNADAQSADLPEPEKPKGPTDADVRRLADEIKSLKRPPTMTEVRDLAMKLYGKNVGRAVYSLLKEDLNKYGLQVVRGDTLAEKLIVPL